MFIHNGENLPQDPYYEADLDKLGYMVDENKQIVNIEDSKHFLFFHTSSDRANEKRKEAMHTCARRLVKQELAELGVVEFFLGGENGREILGVGTKEKPTVKHLPIFITEPEELKKMRDVIVVIGDSSEDAGIWAWRHLLTGGGIVDGSAVGLVENLATLGMDIDSTADQPATTPGIIILNPGARLWSYKEEKTMTMFTWLARDRLHALGEDFAVHKIHNYVEGHSSAHEHIETCLDHILPQVLAENARLYVVGVTNSAEYFINWYQSRQLAAEVARSDSTDVPATPFTIAAMAFMETTHSVSSVKSEAVERKLRECGRQWVKSELPQGEFLTAAKLSDTPTLVPFPETVKGGDLQLPNYNSASTEAATTTITSHTGNEEAAIADLAKQVDKVDLYEPVTGNASVGITSIEAFLASLTENTRTTGLENGTNSDPGNLAPSPESLIANGVSAIQFDDVNPRNDTPQPPASELMLKEWPSEPEEAQIDDYNHTKEIVSCDTYSGGTDIDEMIWPNVMDDVLAFFQSAARRTASPGSGGE